MRSSLGCASLVLASLVASWSCAQPTPNPALLVLTNKGQTLAIVDPANLHVVAHIPVGSDPHEVIASADGKTAYVSNYGNGALHMLTEVDLIGQKPIGTIDLGALVGPHGLDFKDGKVWFTAEVAKAIGSYDPATGKIDWVMGTGQNRTHMIYVFPDARRILTTNVNSGTVTIFDKFDIHPGQSLPGIPTGASLPPGSEWLLTEIPVGTRDEGMDVTPDQKQAWTASPADGTVAVIDLATKRVVATLDAKVVGANRLKFTPDGKLALISAGPDVVILDTATERVIKRLAIGRDSDGIQIEPDGERAFVACETENFVAVIDLKTLQITGRIDVGPGPDGMAWAVRTK